MGVPGCNYRGTGGYKLVSGLVGGEHWVTGSGTLEGVPKASSRNKAETGDGCDVSDLREGRPLLVSLITTRWPHPALSVVSLSASISRDHARSARLMSDEVGKEVPLMDARCGIGVPPPFPRTLFPPTQRWTLQAPYNSREYSHAVPVLTRLPPQDVFK